MADYRHKTWELATPSDEIDMLIAANKAQLLIATPTQISGAYFMHPFDLHIFFEDTSMEDSDAFTGEWPLSKREFITQDWLCSHYDVFASVTTH